MTEDGREAAPSALGGRIVAIDIVRGFAIMWVILYHLWSDMKYPRLHSVPETFRAVPDQVRDGQLWGASTAAFDAFFRAGFLGVPLFMMLSGLSLTLVALRRDMPIGRAPSWLYARLRKLMIPYWFGFAYTVVFMVALAFVQWQRHGGASLEFYVRHGDVPINAGTLFAGATLIPRAFKDEWFYAPSGALWFVVLLLQYYLLFPFLLAALKRIGPWWMIVGGFVVTAFSLSAIVAVRGNLNEFETQRLVLMLAPFRIFEFTLGMALGYLLVFRRELLAEYTSSPFDIAGLVLFGFVLFVGGSMIDPWRGGSLLAYQYMMQVAGMALMLLPLIAKTPGELEVSAPGRLMAWIGVISYTVLIVNEPLRSITHHMSVEDASDALMFLWVGVLYIPLTLLVARPLAVFLGLVERGTPGATDDAEVAGVASPEAAPLQP